jgi:hypothetical protein
MPKKSNYELDITIDKLTNSIQNAISGDSFDTEVLELTQKDLKNVSKRKGWQFNWRTEMNLLDRKVFKLTIAENPMIIQGLISISDKKDHFYLHLIENAPFNLGKNKLYVGVAGNLFAYVCKLSWEAGYEGFVAFESKTQLIAHYEKAIGAVRLAKLRMVILPPTALKLIKQYFNH